MPVNSVLAPYPTFFDATGAPLENGSIYIGAAGFEARTTPKASFFDVALTIPTGTASGAAIRTKGGFPINNSNAPAMFYVDGDFSISVCDRNGVLLYSALNATLALNVGAAVGPVLWADGNLGAVGGGFVNEANTGFVRAGTGTMQTVVQGTLVSQQTNAGTVFQQPVSGAGFVSGVTAALDPDLTALAALSGTGLAVRTASNTWAQRQFVSADGSVTITNPAGVAGNIDLSANAVGVGQTWQDVVGSRAFATSYQNTTGRAITVSARVNMIGTSTATFQVSTDNVTWVTVTIYNHNIGSNLTDWPMGPTVIPPGHYYRLNRTGGTQTTLAGWTELR